MLLQAALNLLELPLLFATKDCWRCRCARGESWARIVTLVIAGLGVLSGLAAFVQPAAGLSRALGVVALVIDVAIIVLLAQRPSSQFFRRAL